MNYMVNYRPNTMSLVGDFDRLLESVFEDFPVFNTRVPAVDIREEDHAYVLEAELPGLNEKDIDIKVEGNLLTLSSKHEEKKEEKKNGCILKERRTSSFSRSFVLPKDVDREKIDATFKNGLLTLTLQKEPKAQPKSIQVKTE